MNNATNNASKPALPIVSAEVAEEITEAFHVLYRLLAASGGAITTPIESTGKAEWERVAVRGMNALAARAAWVKEQEIAAFRQGVRDAISPHIDRAREEKAEFDALSPSLRAKLGAFPTFVTVPLSDVSEVFGSGVEIGAQVKKLTDMGYKVSKQANGVFTLRVDLPKSIIGDSAAK